MRPGGFRATVMASILLAHLGAAGAAGPAVEPADPGRRPRSAILISIDSLRADHLLFYGYPRDTTPFLTRLAERGEAIVFRRPTAVTPSCHPSHVAMLTGLYPQQVGISLCGEDLTLRPADLEVPEDRRALETVQEDLEKSPAPFRRKKISAIMNWMKIPPDTRTLALHLQERGYRTGGFVSIWTLEGRFGYGRGFDVYADDMSKFYGSKGLSWVLRDLLRSQRREKGDATLDRALDFLRALEVDERFFVFLHFADTHVPYGASRAIGFTAEGEADRRELERVWARRYPEEFRDRAMRRMRRDGPFLLDAYDRSLKYVDSLLERLFAYLEESGRRRDTLVVITSDHGDAFGQHPYPPGSRGSRLFFEHSIFVWEETLGVPLLIVDPSGAIPEEAADLNVSHVDIAPTILGLLGLPSGELAPGPLPGFDLSRPTEETRTAFFLSFGRGRPPLLQNVFVDYPRFIGFRRDDLKFFVDRARFRAAGEGSCYLFDLEGDPDEQHNLCARGASDARTARYRAVLVDWWERTTAARRDGGSGTGPAGGRR